jgi:hypothetical protein
MSKDYCGQHYVNKFNNLEEEDKFLDLYYLPRLNHEEIENRNRWIMSNKIESVIKCLPSNKNLEPDDVTTEFHQTFKNKVYQFYLS